MIPDELMKDLEVLKGHGYSCQIIEDGGKIYIKFTDYPLPQGIYNVDKTEVLIFTTPHYPNAGFDMFWASPNLSLKNNGHPKSAEVFEPHLGTSWRRFSYHPYQQKPWNPSEDSIITFVEHVRQRLVKGD